MGSSTDHPPRASPEFLAVFRAHADETGTMTFAHFMELALYHPEVGYYRQNRRRVGYESGTDYFTASTSGSVFGELVSAACAQLLAAAGRDPRTHTFVEIGAESASGLLGGIPNAFSATRTIRIGEPISLAGDCVVFSNELFDAQPCVRTVTRGGAWRELGVRLEGTGLVEIELPSAWEQPVCPEGYIFDRPLAAGSLADTIAGQSWRGLFVAFDYGKTYRELASETPAGTARAYYRHSQSNDLLAHPGEQDLTCHVCWDWVAEAWRRHEFAEPTLEFQETFFIRHAADYIQAASTADAARFSQRKLALLQLLHPAHMGQKFQVLHALR